MHLAEPPAGTGTSLDRPVPAYSDGSARRRALRWTARHNTPLTIVAAGLVPILYLVFIGSYAVNSFQADDWSLVPLVHAALHGGLSLGQLWQQHNESRLLVGNVIDVLFGFTDRLDARAIIFFSAGVFIAAYVCLLMLARKYLPTRLTPITVVTIGVLWFSLADIQNILWAFQVSWYLTVFFFVAMLYSLLVPERRRVLWFAAAVLLAVASSLSTVQGFISWPIGAICILWPGPSRRGRSEIAIWFGTMLGAVAAYLPGYRFNQGNTCVAAARCTTSFELHHPLTSASFFFALIGNVIPGPIAGFSAHLASPARFVVVGLALFAAALFVLVQSWRLRASAEALPLPALLVVFGLLFDLTIAVGRSGSGIAEAVTFNRYVMANLILLTGIVLYALRACPAHCVLVRVGLLACLPHVRCRCRGGALHSGPGHRSHPVRRGERSNDEDRAYRRGAISRQRQFAPVLSKVGFDVVGSSHGDTPRCCGRSSGRVQPIALSPLPGLGAAAGQRLDRRHLFLWTRRLCALSGPTTTQDSIAVPGS